MNWEALGAIGEVVGAVSVLITVLYLAVQIKESAKSQHTVSYNSMIEGYNTFISWCISTEELSKTSQRMFNETGEELTDLEIHRLNFMFRAFTNHIYRLFNLYEGGALSEEQWKINAVEADQIFNLTEFGKNFRKENMAYASMWHWMEQLDSQELSRF